MKFSVPSFQSGATIQADFSHIVELFLLESSRPLKMARQLTPTALNPTSIQRTSMKLSLSIFSESTVAALRYYSENEQKPWLETAEFLETILKLWNVLNVKSPDKGHHKRNITMDPVKGISDWKLKYLREMSMWLKSWKSSQGNGLSRETFLALEHTCRGVSELSEYLMNELDFKYVLLGKLQSDPIEKRFGCYRQLSGANYFVSVRQVLENEKKIRLVSLLKFSKLSLEEMPPVSEEIRASDIRNTNELFENVKNISILDNIDMSDSNVIFYVSGYVGRSLVKRKKCHSCYQNLLGSGDFVAPPISPEIKDEFEVFFNTITRGGLSRPSEFVYMIALVCFCLLERLRSEPLRIRFLSTKNCRTIFLELVLRKISYDPCLESLLNVQLTCEHLVTDLIKAVAFHFFNCMAKRLSEDITNKAVTVKRSVFSPSKGSTARKVRKLNNE